MQQWFTIAFCCVVCESKPHVLRSTVSQSPYAYETSIQILHSHQSGSSFILEDRGQLILHHSLFFWTRSTTGKNLGTLNLCILSKLFLVKHCCKLFSDSNFSKWLLSTLLNGLPKMSQHVFIYFYPLLFLLIVRNLNCNHGISSFSRIPILVI